MNLNPKKQTIINFRITKEEEQKLLKLAHKYTEGNLSAWIRYAGLHHVPKKKKQV